MTAADTQLLAAFGHAIAARRRQLGYSQQQIADLAGLNRSSIANIESGRQNVHLTQLVILCQALELSADTVLGLTGTPQPPAVLLRQAESAATVRAVRVLRAAVTSAVSAAVASLTAEPGFDPHAFRRTGPGQPQDPPST